MGHPSVHYATRRIEKRVHAWAKALNFDPEEQIAMLLEDRFGVAHAKVVSASLASDTMVMTVETDTWDRLYELGLTEGGSLIWSTPCPPRPDEDC
jgi:hypothetical protein